MEEELAQVKVQRIAQWFLIAGLPSAGVAALSSVLFFPLLLLTVPGFLIYWLVFKKASGVERWLRSMGVWYAAVGYNVLWLVLMAPAARSLRGLEVVWLFLPATAIVCSIVGLLGIRAQLHFHAAVKRSLLHAAIEA